MQNQVLPDASTPFSQVYQKAMQYAPQLLGAALLLLLGYLAGRLFRYLALKLTTRLDRWITGRRAIPDDGTAGAQRLAYDIVGRLVFWMVFLVFLAAAMEVLGLPSVTAGLASLAQYLPAVVGAVLILLAGIVLGGVARTAIVRGAISARLAQGEVIGQIVRIVILIEAGIIALGELGIDSTALVQITGIALGALIGGAALAFALGARGVVGNILSAHYLAQTYRVGQRVRLGQIEGRIVEFKPTGAVLEAQDGRVLVPAKEFTESPSVLLVGEGQAP
jgi:small-conductance mechanosensitive channel